MASITDIPGWQDMTGQQIKDFCDSHPSTVAPMKADDLQRWMRLNRLYKLNRAGVAEGVIPDLVDNPALPLAMREQLEGLLSSFRESFQAPIETNSAEYAPLLAGLMAIVEVSDEVLAEFYQLGGGRKYPVFASAQAATNAKAAAVASTGRQSAKEAIDSRAGAAMFAAAAAYDAGGDAAAITAAGVAAWGDE